MKTLHHCATHFDFYRTIGLLSNQSLGANAKSINKKGS
jgi:hypothetical protein